MPDGSPAARPALRLRAFDPARPGDREAVLDICLRTGDAGRDASARHADARVLTDRYATPYLELEPALAVLAVRGDEVVGYVLGTADTVRFAERFAAHPSSLTPAERREHADRMLLPELAELPAHLHIDLLPEAQGHGAGRALIEAFVAALPVGTTGVHLTVDPVNTGAQAFYPRVGFHELRRSADGVLFGRVLRAAAASAT